MPGQQREGGGRGRRRALGNSSTAPAHGQPSPAAAQPPSAVQPASSRAGLQQQHSRQPRSAHLLVHKGGQLLDGHKLHLGLHLAGVDVVGCSSSRGEGRSRAGRGAGNRAGGSVSQLQAGKAVGAASYRAGGHQPRPCQGSRRFCCGISAAHCRTSQHAAQRAQHAQRSAAHRSCPSRRRGQSAGRSRCARGCSACLRA